MLMTLAAELSVLSVSATLPLTFFLSFPNRGHVCLLTAPGGALSCEGLYEVTETRSGKPSSH